MTPRPPLAAPMVARSLDTFREHFDDQTLLNFGVTWNGRGYTLHTI